VFVGLLIVIIILGVVAAMVPMPGTVRNLVIAAAVILFVVWILALLGLLPLGVDRPVVERPVIVR